MSDTITLDGLTFRVTIERDEDSAAIAGSFDASASIAQMKNR